MDAFYADYPTYVIDYVLDSPKEVRIPIRSMSFPLDIHLLIGLETLPNHLSRHILNNEHPKSPLEGMIALSTCHLNFINLCKSEMKALKVYKH